MSLQTANKESQQCGYEKYLPDVHRILQSQPEEAICHESYLYYHYGCDGVDDRGWGCGYRTLQTLCSWMRHLQSSSSPPPKPVPSLLQIQSALVEMGDKSDTFLHSKQWIGSFEVCLILDYFYDVPCKILHIAKGSDIVQFLPELYKHFKEVGTPVMMGGETDNASKGVMGVRLKDPALLIVDPHYFGKNPTLEDLQNDGCVKWLPIEDLHADTFYNMCLPKPLTR